MFLDDLAHHIAGMRADGGGEITTWVNHENGPTGNEHEQSHGCLVDFRQAFKCYEQIADDEYGNDS